MCVCWKGNEWMNPEILKVSSTTCLCPKWPVFLCPPLLAANCCLAGRDNLLTELSLSRTQEIFCQKQTLIGIILSNVHIELTQHISIVVLDIHCSMSFIVAEQHRRYSQPNFPTCSPKIYWSTFLIFESFVDLPRWISWINLDSCLIVTLENSGYSTAFTGWKIVFHFSYLRDIF